MLLSRNVSLNMACLQTAYILAVNANILSDTGGNHMRFPSRSHAMVVASTPAGPTVHLVL
jgi:xanthine/uracil/vitamin C permease (AzgA family)